MRVSIPEEHLRPEDAIRNFVAGAIGNCKPPGVRAGIQTLGLMIE